MTVSHMAGAAYLLDKSAGISSRSIASEVAKFWGYRKFGHAGTLDPDATGLLIVMMGKATRLSRFILSSRKTYSFGIELGIRTDTDDTAGTIIERKPVSNITKEDIIRVIGDFTGSIQQKVPSYSAVKINGRRAYSLARSGLMPSTPVREAYTENWEMKGFDGRKAYFSVTVSSGTYIRALARDIGNTLETGGAAFDIRRTSIGAFSVDEASSKKNDVSSRLSMTDILRKYERIVLDAEQSRIVSHGGKLSSNRTGILALLDKDNNLLAVAEGNGSMLKPLCVLVEN